MNTTLRNLSLLLFVVSSLFSCEDVIPDSGNTTEHKNTHVLVSIRPLSRTRTSVELSAEDIVVNWETSDAITLFDSQGKRLGNLVYKCDTIDAQTAFFETGGIFALNDSEEYTVVHPATNATTLEQAKVNLNLSEQLQDGKQIGHLNNACHLRGKFTYHPSQLNEVGLEHQKSIMKISYITPSEIKPTKVTFKDGDTHTYVLNLTNVVTSSQYDFYLTIEPSEDVERTISATVEYPMNDPELGTEQVLTTTISEAYELGGLYSNTISQTGWETVGSPSDLQLLAEKVSQGKRDLKVLLTQDIDLENIPMTPIGSESQPFVGYFYGNHKVISNLTLNDVTDYQGLFAHISESTLIKDLTLQNPNVVGVNYVGAIAGMSTASTIQNCCVSQGSISGVDFVGGFVGKSLTNSVISNCSNSANLIGKVGGSFSRTGGIVGGNDASLVEACVNEGDITGISRIGGIAGFNYANGVENATIAVCYNMGRITGNESLGGIVGASSHTGNGGLSTVAACYNVSNQSIVGQSDFGGVLGANSKSVVQATYYVAADPFGVVQVGVECLSSLESLNSKVDEMNRNIPYGIFYAFQKAAQVASELPIIKPSNGNTDASSNSQIVVNLSEKRQQFYGAGGTCGLYIGHWRNMNTENRLLAAQMIAKDINLKYVKSYVNTRPSDDSKEFDSFIDFVNDIRKVNSAIKVQICVNDLPDDLEEFDGNKVDKDGNRVTKKSIYKKNDPEIFQKMAQYYFDVIEYFSARGVPVDQLDILNEPGGVDYAVFHGKKFSESVPILKTMISKTSFQMPQIVGPSLWGVAGTVKWFDAWNASIPQAYKNVDVVSTHGYEGGWEEKNYQLIRNYIGADKPFMNNEQTGKLQKGDKLYEIYDGSENAPDFIGDVSIALRISDAVNGGVNHFFVFQLNNSAGSNAALLKTPYGGAPSKSKIYSGFKQLTSYQPDGAYCLGKQLINVGCNRVLCFRKDEQNEVYVHVTNITAETETYDISLSENGAKLAIESYEGLVSDEALDEEPLTPKSFETPQEYITFTASPFSVNSLKIRIAE